MNERIVFVMPDQSVQIAHPALRGRREAEDPMAWFKRVADKSRPKEAIGDAIVVDVSDLPTEHRNAWVWDGSKVVVDPSRIKRKAERQVQAVSAGEPFNPTPLYEQIDVLKQQNAALLERLNQLVDYVTSCRRHDALVNASILASKKDTEVPTAEDRQRREDARALLQSEASRRQLTVLECAEQIKNEADAEIVRLVTG